MKAWIVASDGWRTWANATGPRWREVSGSLVAERDGVVLELAPTAADRATAKRITEKLAPGLSDVLVRLLGAGQAADWYMRALLALACVECPQGTLPCLGDCRKDGVPVPCGSAGADSPRSAGFYQITRGTVPRTGFTFADLQKDPAANHRAALNLARDEQGRHDFDFPSLCVIWNAGSVRPDAGNRWGVHTWSAELVSRYVRYFNAIGPVSASSSKDGGGAVVAGLALALYLMSSAACSSSSDRDAARAAELNAITREVCELVLAEQPSNADVRRLCIANRIVGAFLPALAPSSSSSAAPACSSTTGGTCPAP